MCVMSLSSVTTPLELTLDVDFRDEFGVTLLLIDPAAPRNQLSTMCNVGIVPHTIMRKSSPVTQAKMSYVAQV